MATTALQLDKYSSGNKQHGNHGNNMTTAATTTMTRVRGIAMVMVRQLQCKV